MRGLANRLWRAPGPARPSGPHGSWRGTSLPNWPKPLRDRASRLISGLPAHMRGRNEFPCLRGDESGWRRLLPRRGCFRQR